MLRANIIGIAFCLSAILSLKAEGWTEFRGQTGQGIAPSGTYPVEWGPDHNVAWKQSIPGKGWSSPVVENGRVYLTTAITTENAKDLSLEALCLDAVSGKILWQRDVFHQPVATSARIHAKNSHASATPLINKNRLFVHFGHQGTACLNLQGNVLWKNTSLHYSPVHGNGGSPILVDNALIFSCDGGDDRFIVALQADSGNVLWKTERSGEADKKFSFSTPLLISVNGQKQVLSPGSNSINAYDPATGREIWRVRYDGYSVIPRPVFGQGLIFISTGYNTPVLIAIRPDGKGDVTDTHIAWKKTKGAPNTPSPLIHGDELYLVSDNGIASCLDAKTGKPHWQERIGGNFSASPLLAGDKLYLQSEEGVGTVLRAGKKFEKLAKNDLVDRSLASYAAMENSLYIRTEKNLYCVRNR